MLITLAVQEDQGTRLDRWLARRLPDRARNQIQHDLDAGRILVNDEAQPARYRVRLGDRIGYDLPDAPDAAPGPESIALQIAFEDEHLLVIDKPAGLVVHPAPGHEHGTLVNGLLAHCGPSLVGVGGEGRWGIVHRLDHLTSGLLVAARTQPAYEALVAAMAERRVSREYLGVVVGTMRADGGVVDQPVGRRRSDRKKMGVVREGGREARTRWRVLCQGRGLALLALTLETGRTHQIRVHLQSIGRPVVGDPEYGWTKPRTLQAIDGPLRPRLAALWPGRQLLHAARLTFHHPLIPACLLQFQSPPPEDMVRVMDAFWGDAWREPLRAWLGHPPMPLQDAFPEEPGEAE